MARKVRCVSIKPGNMPFMANSYTVGKEYEILEYDEDGIELGINEFEIIDDEGDRLICYFEHDPDVVWELVEE